VTLVRVVFQGNADTCQTEIEDNRCEDRHDEADGIRIVPDGSDLTKRWVLLQLHRK